MDATIASGIAVRVDALAKRVREGVLGAAHVREPMLLARVRTHGERDAFLAPVRGDAQEAVELLDTLPRDAPVLELRRTLRAAAGVAQPWKSRSDHFALAERIADQSRAVRAWAETVGLDRSQRVAELERIRGIDAADIEPRDWRLLSGILDADPGRQLAPGLPREFSSDGLPLVELARSAGAGGPAAGSAGKPGSMLRRYLDAWKVGVLPQARRAEQLDELLSRDPTSLTRDDWRRIAALLDVDPAAGATSGSAFVREARSVASYPHVPTTRAERLVQTGRLERSPELRAAIRAELLDPGSEPSSASARAVLAAGQLELVGITGNDARAVRIRHHVPTDPADATPWLRDVDGWLRSRTVPPELEPIRAHAYEFVARNEARIAGTVRDGYVGHPDYAELGRLGSIVRLIDVSLSRPVTAPAPAAPAPAPGSLAEQLPW